jgi:hypothetical protein
MNLNAPDDIAQLYATSDGWTRDKPWHRSSRADHFETTYSIEVAQKVRVYLAKNVIKNEAAALWEIARQIKSAVNGARRFQGNNNPKQGHRRSRPSKRIRETERNGNQQTSGVCCADAAGSEDPQQ